MNTLVEHNTQVGLKYFAALYGELSQALLQWEQGAGERTIRRAVEAYALEKGGEIRDRQRRSGKSIDLQNLFAAENCCGSDSGFQRVIIQDTKQVQRQEVHRCPLADVWAERACSFAGSLYCEEYAHALLKGYTDGVGQANVSNALTYPRDHACVLSFYYRPANMTQQQREEFQTGAAAGAEFDVSRNMLRLCHAFDQAAREQGSGASEAVARGMSRFLGEMERENPEQEGATAVMVEKMRAAFGRKE